MSDFYSNNNSVKIVFPNSEQPKLKDLRYVYEHTIHKQGKNSILRIIKCQTQSLMNLVKNVIFTYI